VGRVYDATGRQVASQSDLGYPATTVFDVTGQQTALLDANCHRTSSLYSGRGDLLATPDALGAFTSGQYDALGNASLRVDARNQRTTDTVDALNRTVGQLCFGGTRVTNSFAGAGQQTTQQDLLGVRSFGLAGRQTSVAFPTGRKLTNNSGAQ
jgi:YD repeat-containing protein